MHQNGDELSWKHRAPVCVTCLTGVYFTYIPLPIQSIHDLWSFDYWWLSHIKSQWCGKTYLGADVQRCSKYLQRDCTGHAHILALFFAGSVARSCWQAAKSSVNRFRDGATPIGPFYWNYRVSSHWYTRNFGWRPRVALFWPIPISWSQAWDGLHQRDSRRAQEVWHGMGWWGGTVDLGVFQRMKE